MRKMYGFIILMTLVASLVMIGCNQVTDNPISPSVESSENNNEQLVVAELSNATCSQYCLDGKDPIDWWCDRDAITVPNSKTFIKHPNNGSILGYVELRWSAQCGTNWGRVVRTDGAGWDGWRWLALSVWVERSSPKATLAPFTLGSSYVYSDMLYARYSPAKACGTIDTGNQVGRACTGLF